jgi:NAD(P)-dependent dehydrogenase (short-subunit alcohol dehydrogenase family)
MVTGASSAIGLAVAGALALRPIVQVRDVVLERTLA